MAYVRPTMYSSAGTVSHLYLLQIKWEDRYKDQVKIIGGTNCSVDGVEHILAQCGTPKNLELGVRYELAYQTLVGILFGCVDHCHAGGGQI